MAADSRATPFSIEIQPLGTNRSSCDSVIVVPAPRRLARQLPARHRVDAGRPDDDHLVGPAVARPRDLRTLRGRGAPLRGSACGSSGLRRGGGALGSDLRGRRPLLRRPLGRGLPVGRSLLGLLRGRVVARPVVVRLLVGLRRHRSGQRRRRGSNARRGDRDEDRDRRTGEQAPGPGSVHRLSHRWFFFTTDVFTAAFFTQDFPVPGSSSHPAFSFVPGPFGPAFPFRDLCPESYAALASAWTSSSDVVASAASSVRTTEPFSTAT